MRVLLTCLLVACIVSTCAASSPLPSDVEQRLEATKDRRDFSFDAARLGVGGKPEGPTKGDEKDGAEGGSRDEAVQPPVGIQNYADQAKVPPHGPAPTHFDGTPKRATGQLDLAILQRRLHRKMNPQPRKTPTPSLQPLKDGDSRIDGARIGHRLKKSDGSSGGAAAGASTTVAGAGGVRGLWQRHASNRHGKMKAAPERQQERSALEKPAPVVADVHDPSRTPDAFAAQKLSERRHWRHRYPVAPVATIAARAAAMDKHIPVLTVVGMTLAMAGAAGLGALPFFIVRKLSPHWSAVATAVACGVMFAASFDLIHEGQPYGARMVVLGVFLGGIFIRFIQRWLDSLEDVKFGHVHGTNARRLVLMVGIMAAHAVGEGCGVGVSFCGDRGWAQGVLTTLAIGVHNVPEGLAKATMLVAQGATPYEALFWSVVTCLPQPLVAVPSFLFVETFRALLPTALGFAAGCMIWMVFAELLPDALKGAHASEVASAATLSAAALEGIRMSFEALEGPAGAFLSPLPNMSIALLGPAAAGIAPAVVVAAVAAAAVAGTSLPTPVVMGFAAAVMAACGAAPLAYLTVNLSAVHTLSAAAAGAAAALLARRYSLRALAARGGGGGISPILMNGKGHGDDHLNDCYNSSGNGMATGELAWGGGGGAAAVGGYGAVSGQGMTQRRADSLHYSDAAQPCSTPSKPRQPLSSHPVGDIGSGKAGRRLTVPAQAAAVAVLCALLARAATLGWDFTRQIAASSNAAAAVPAMVLTLAVHGGAAGGAVRAAVGRSAGAGGLVGFLVGGIAASVLLSSLAEAPASAAEAVRALSFPRGWLDTATALSCGALCMAALMQVAVAMSIHPKHARLGLGAAVAVLGGTVAVASTWCRVAGSGSGACSALSAFLR